MTTNYTDAFISVAPDRAATECTEPRPNTNAALQLAMLCDHPYRYTSDDLLFAAHVHRNAVRVTESNAERATFVAKPRACLRASPLVKSYGWGLHHDAHERVAAYGIETKTYKQLISDAGLKQTQGMRSKRV